MGNRTHKVHTDTQGAIKAESYNYPENSEGNRLLSQTENTVDQQSLDLIDGETQTLEYNQNGSPKNNNGFSYEYNANQRPIKVFKQTQGNNTNNSNNKELLAEYRYNSFGERIKKVSYSQGKKAKVTYFLYDGHTLTAEIEKPLSRGVAETMLERSDDSPKGEVSISKKQKPHKSGGVYNWHMGNTLNRQHG